MKSKLVVLSAVAVLFFAGHVFAGVGQELEDVVNENGAMAVGAKVEAVNVGNKICPVSGESVDEMGKPYEVEQDGKIYNLCCAMCAKDFKKDPQKFIKIIEQELMQQGSIQDGEEQDTTGSLNAPDEHEVEGMDETHEHQHEK